MNYAEAIDIRLRAAQNQYITPGALAEAHRVVAATRAAKAEPDRILVHPSEPLPFVVERSVSTPKKKVFSMVVMGARITGNKEDEPAVIAQIQALREPVKLSQCKQRCNHLGVCQAYRSCERPL
jgi:hypothetical protein